MNADALLLETQRAFDGVAAGYDRSNAGNRLLCAMRERARSTLVRFVSPGARILDLGCGPGTDAVELAKRGYRLTAVDWSPAMVHEAQQFVDANGLSERVTVRRLGIHEIGCLEPGGFDAVYSNFGPLNCAVDLGEALALIAARLRRDGVFIASVIGRVCPWEVGFYLLRGDWRRATVRFSRGLVPVPLAGRIVWTRYYAPGSFTRACVSAGLTPLWLRSLGLFAPPPYLQAFADRHPRAIGALERIDDRLGALPMCRQLGDHFLIALRKS
jgi:SAM-dependent methyltransferase